MQRGGMVCFVRTFLGVLMVFVLFVAPGSGTELLFGWQFSEMLGSVWMQRTTEPGVPVSSGELCADTPRIDFVTTQLATQDGPSGGSDELDTMELLFRLGKWSVRPLHVWGVYAEIGCKEPLGWGTAFLVGLYKRHYIWITVEHNVLTQKYFSSSFGHVVATNWFIQDEDGAFKELFLVGCKDGKFCVLQSSYIHGTLPISLDTDYISNDIQQLERTYVYGCSVISEAVRRYVHYRLHHFCLGTDGYVNSPNALNTLVGGDVLVSNPTMPGFSGAPLLTWREDEHGRFILVGTVNSGVEGVVTAANFVSEDAIVRVQEWLSAGERLFTVGGDDSTE